MNKGIEYIMNMSEPWALPMAREWTHSKYFKSYDHFIRWAYDWKQLPLPDGIGPILKKYQKRTVIITQSYLLKKHRCTLYFDAYLFCLYVMFRSGIRYYSSRHIENMLFHYFYMSKYDYMTTLQWAFKKKFKMYSRKLTELEWSTVSWAHENRTGFSAIKFDRAIDESIMEIADKRGWHSKYPKDLRGVHLPSDYLFKDILNNPIL